MDEIGLYYPYFRVRDEAWLKAVALYLPRLARIRPVGHETRESETARRLRDDLDFIIDIDPGSTVEAVAGDFEDLLSREGEALRDRYNLRALPGPGGTKPQQALHDEWDGRLGKDPRLAWIHENQVSFLLQRRLEDLELAVGGRNPFERDPWLGMHPRLVEIYSCAFANRVATANLLRPTTDRPEFHAVSADWTVDELIQILLDPSATRTPGGPDQVSEKYAFAAFTSVVPDGLDDVPVEKIIQARKDLAPEFEEFRAHMRGLSEEFTRLSRIQEPGILQQQLQDMVERDLTRPVAELERGSPCSGSNRSKP